MTQTNKCLLYECETNKLPAKRLRASYFVRVPTDPDLKEKWLQRLGGNPSKIRIQATALLCSDHFNPSDLHTRFKTSNVTNVQRNILPIPYRIDLKDTAKSARNKTKSKAVNRLNDEEPTEDDSMDASNIRRSNRKGKAKIHADGEPLVKKFRACTKAEHDNALKHVKEDVDKTPEQVESTNEVADQDAMCDFENKITPQIIDKTIPNKMMSDVETEIRVENLAKSVKNEPTNKPQPIKKVKNIIKLKKISSNIMTKGEKTSCFPVMSLPASAFPVLKMSHISTPITKTTHSNLSTSDIAQPTLVSQLPTSSDRNKIVVTAKNIQLIKQALAHKKVVVPVSGQGLIKLVHPSKLVAATATQKTIANETSLTVTPTQPYPINLISVQSNADKPTTNNSVKSSPHQGVKETAPPVPCLTPIRVAPKAILTKPKENSAITPVFKAMPTLKQFIPTPAAKPLTKVLVNSITPEVDTPSQPTLTEDQQTKSVQPENQYLNLDIDFGRASNKGPFHLNTVNQQLNTLSLVVQALRDELAKQKDEIRCLRQQNTRIIQSNQKLIDIMGLKKIAAVTAQNQKPVAQDQKEKPGVVIKKRSNSIYIHKPVKVDPQ